MRFTVLEGGTLGYVRVAVTILPIQLKAGARVKAVSERLTDRSSPAFTLT